MSRKETRFWRSFAITIILAGLVTFSVWAVSLMINGTTSFSTQNQLTLEITGVNSNTIINDASPTGLDCQSSFSSSRWTLQPQNSSGYDVCEHSFSYVTDLPVFIGSVTADPASIGYIDVTLISPTCGTLIPAGVFDVTLQSEIGVSAGEGQTYDFPLFTLEFDESAPSCPP